MDYSLARIKEEVMRSAPTEKARKELEDKSPLECVRLALGRMRSLQDEVREYREIIHRLRSELEDAEAAMRLADALKEFINGR